MTSSQLQQFLARVSQDPELERRLEAAGADPSAIAAAAGFTITTHDYSASQARWHEWRLSSTYDEEM
jgi:predicted ribosomally synthesized peptide with nif11-like leader